MPTDLRMGANRSVLLDRDAGGDDDIVTDHGAALDLGAGSDDHADFGPTRCFASLLLYRLYWQEAQGAARAA